MIIFKIIAGGTAIDFSAGGPATAKVEVRIRGLKLAKESYLPFDNSPLCHILR